MAQPDASSPQDSTTAHESQCPLCGYDLRGQMQQWRHSCPLDGHCVECGYDFEWADLLSPKHQPPAWHVEFARGPTRLCTSILASFWASLRPTLLWQRLKPSHPPSIKRLVRYVFIQCCLAYACWGILNIIWLFAQRNEALVSAKQVSLQHNLPPIVINDLVLLVLFPWEVISYTRTYTHDFYYLDNLLISLGLMTCLMWAHSLLGILSFAPLPLARRKAKVCWFHLLRIGLMNLPHIFWIALLLIATTYLFNFGQMTMAYVHFAVPWLWALALWWYWQRACKYYLQMSHSVGVSFAIVMIAGLATLILGVWGTLMMMLMNVI